MNTTYTKSLKKFKVGTMCSGIGTPEIALKNLGIDFEVVYAAEIDKNARKTYLENHKVGTFYEDLTKIDMNELSYVDCFIMGFPCQSYSQQGLRLGLNDPRGTILF